MTREPSPIQLPDLEPWMSAWGHDERGPWCAFEVDPDGARIEQRMRWCPPGRFVMGSPESESGRLLSEGPQRQVTLTRGFWMAETTCTQAMWKAVMGNEPTRFESDNEPDSRVLPVERVSWHDVQQFIAKLNSTIPRLNVRLPSEAEWEYACRAGDPRPTYNGDPAEDATRVLDEIAVWSGNSHGRPAPVGSKRPNAWGLYDTIGNLWEWCEDAWRDRYDSGNTVDPFVDGEGAGAFRVSRGGSWVSVARLCRAAFRDDWLPDGRNGYLGFRLARGHPLRSRSQGAERG
jgi:formylglycine-generating enzyme required for sulfatase activity